MSTALSLQQPIRAPLGTIAKAFLTVSVFGLGGGIAWAMCTGTKLRVVPGALAAIAGFLVLPWSVGLALGVFCLRYAQAPLLRHVLGGVSAAAAGLLIAAGA